MRGIGACADGKGWGAEIDFPGVAAYGHPPEGGRVRIVGPQRWLRCIRTLRGARKVHGPQAIGKSHGGWTTKVHMMVANERRALAFSAFGRRDGRCTGGSHTAVQDAPIRGRGGGGGIST